MSIRIDEDGTIVSSDGAINQGQNPLIREDGSIRLNEGSGASVGSAYVNTRRPPSSPLENSSGINQSVLGEQNNAQDTFSGRGASSALLRNMSTIEYELRVKRAELSKCIRLAPIVVCIAFILISFLASSLIPAIISAGAGVLVIVDLVKWTQISEEVQGLEKEFEQARNGTRG